MEYETIKLSILAIGTLSALGVLLTSKLIDYKLKNKKELKENIKINNIIDTKKLLDDILFSKYEYYLTSEILAYFLNDKDIDKKKIKELKESYYLDVSNSISDDLKNEILKLFTIKGIKLYIHQTFLRLLNESNIKYSSGSSLDKRTLKAIYEINEGSK